MSSHHPIHRSDPFRPSLSTFAGLLVLLLGLLGMHVLGMGHASFGATESAAAHTTASGHHGAATETGGNAATGQHRAHQPASADSERHHGFMDDCCMAAMAGMCLVALVAGASIAHLAARAFMPVPGRGLSAPPAMWAPPARDPRPPSLVQLSISRT